MRKFLIGLASTAVVFLAAAIALALGITMGQGQTPRASAIQVAFQSASYSDFRQLLTRDAPTASVTVSATLRFPPEEKERYPAVVIVHTIAGYLESNEGHYAAELGKAGFATLTYDSFAARGTSGVAMSRAGPGLWPSTVADAYAALQLLAAHPKIDAHRIAIVGFSFGGEVAHLAAFASLRSALNPGSARFAAHVAFYPAGVFGVIADPEAYSGSPILMLLGEKDDNLPVTKVEGYLAYAKAAGHPAPIETVIYAGAYHAWTVPDLTVLRFYPEYVSTKKCPLLLIGPGRPAFLVDGEVKPFDASAFGRCMGEAPGYSMVYDAAVRAKSTVDAIGFLQRHLTP
jgi:dienelactone hydrolase